MKLVSVLATTVLSSHYRGGTYIFKSNADGTTSIQQTQTYRDGMAGITPFGTTCTKAHEGALANNYVRTSCSLFNGATCPDQWIDWPYTVGYSSNRQMGGSNDYCYGSYERKMRTPSAGYRIGWSGGAWVDMTDDFGRTQTFNRGNMEVYATINVPTNNSPVFTHPPLWRIMAGCDGQKIDLSPVDPDGDRVKCRWAKITASGFWEAGAATYNAAAWPSLSLDEDNCIVTYTGSMDQTYYGVKGVGIMMEDFDANGNIKSSIPVQFLAAVWTPQTVSRGVALPFVYPDWFAETDGDHHHDHMDGDDHKPSKKGNKKGKNRGRRTTTPSYCSAVPTIDDETPDDGSVIEPSANGSFEIVLSARSSGGYIKSYSFEKPALMTCTNPDSNGRCTCTWTPNDSDRQTRDHGFCFLATDSLGLTTERRCVTLRVPLKQACLSGYENSANGSCQDIDECSRNTDNCHQNAECRNVPGSFTCSCNSGYRGDGVTCSDLNECSTGNHNCHYAAKCSNTPGSFTCACNSGYRGDGVACTEIDECHEGSDNCDSNAKCSNTPGSFTCACNDGFRGNGVSCNDINECAAGTDNCDANAKCSNTIGSFTCACNNGYEGDGVTCHDIDECARETDNDCHEFAKCTNTPGSFTCACLSGYRGDGRKCQDIDECAEGIHACDINAECNNTQGAYDCTCNIGFEGNGFSCVDIDECLTGAHACHAFGTCTNTIGSYDCACNDGYMGDGFLCTVPCATFYDTGKDGFLTNTSAFNTGTFDVTNLATFDTSPSQDGVSNWKMDSSFNNKASFVAVKEKCTLEGFSANNFGGKKLGKWQGGFNNENVFQFKGGKNNKISSFKCNCNKEQSCNSFYTGGKTIPAGCPTPTCNVDYEITDAWGKHGAHNTGQNNRNNQPIKFGYVFKIKVPAEYWTRKGFSIMIRWRDIQSASFQLWNANFFNIYRKNGGIDVLIHSRPHDANWDRAGVHEFVFVADRLAVNSLPEMFFFDGRQMKHNCFHFGLRGEQVGASFESAIEESDAVGSYEEVGEVYVPRMGNMRVKK